MLEQDSETTVSQEIPQSLVNESFLLFLLDRWMISSGELRGEKYSFRDRPFLFDIANDDFPFLVVCKSAQCGITELFIARAIHSLTSRRGNILYTFPALQQLRQLVGARVRPAIEQNPALFKMVSGALNLEQIQIGNNTLYFRGVQNRRQMITVDVSELYVDELDTAVLEAARNNFGNVLYTLEKRLGAARKPRKFFFSTPSFSGMGIDAEFAGDDTNPGSDQREWFVKCRFCGKSQALTWDDNIVDYREETRGNTAYVPDVHRVCAACHEEFSVEDVVNGRWVAKKPEISRLCHGYHVSKLMVAAPNLNQMKLDSLNPVKEQEFRCSDLGIPFEPKGSKITDDILEVARNAKSYVMTGRSSDPTYFGCDVGKALHVVFGVPTPDGNIKVIWAGELEGWRELDAKISQMNARFGVIDAQPGGLEQKEFCISHPGRVKAAYYPSYMETTKDIFKDKDEVLIHLNRTLLMSMVIQAFFNERVWLPVDIRGVRDFYKMLKAPVKATQEDQTGNMRTYFPPTRVVDHYFHAFVYLMAAIERRPKDLIFIERGVFY